MLRCGPQGRLHPAPQGAGRVGLGGVTVRARPRAFSGGWYWQPLVPELEARGHTVEAIDLPGHGEDRTPPERARLDTYCELIAEALRAGEAAVLVGHSTGGIVVTQAAARRATAWIASST